MSEIIALLLLIAQTGGATVSVPTMTPPPTQTQVAEPVSSIVPDVVVRGRSSQLVVKGRDLTVLKTIDAKSGEGLRIAQVQPLPAPAEGGAAVSVTIVVDPGAAPGPRELTVVDPSQGTVVTTVRPGADLPPDVLKDLEAFGRRALTVTAGAIHVNGHEIAITGAQLTGSGARRSLRMTVVDEAGDLVPAEGALEPQVLCGDRLRSGDLLSNVTPERQGSNVVVSAELDASDVSSLGGCVLKVRAKDKAGNLSAWFETKVDG